MKAYRVVVEVKTKWTLEVHANDEQHATEQAEEMGKNDIECAGEYDELVGVEVTDVELAYPDDEEDVEIEDETEETETESESETEEEPNV